MARTRDLLDDGGSADPRAVLDRLVSERGEDYAALSRMIGRNAAYVQQFIKRGSPRRLAERDRALLAAYFAIDERLLGAPASAPFASEPAFVARPRTAPLPGSVPPGALLPVPRLDVGASAGPGAIADSERAEAMFGFDPRWLRRLSANPGQLAIIRVEGDSMVPTLADGDEIMVDAADGAGRLRDGIYVLRRDETLLVKRLACGSGASKGRRRVAIVSDNDAYPAERDVPIDKLTIVGRVVWAGRRIS